MDRRWPREIPVLELIIDAQWLLVAQLENRYVNSSSRPSFFFVKRKNTLSGFRDRSRLLSKLAIVIKSFLYKPYSHTLDGCEIWKNQPIEHALDRTSG